MFFDVWWKGIVFGAVNLVGVMAIAYALTGMWKKYEVAGKDQNSRCALGDHR